MNKLYREVIRTGEPDFEGDKTGVTHSYEYVRDEQAEKDAELGKAVKVAARKMDLAICALEAEDMGMTGLADMLDMLTEAIDAEQKREATRKERLQVGGSS